MPADERPRRARARRCRADGVVAARAARGQRARAARRTAAAGAPDRPAPRRHRSGVAARPPPAAVDELDGRGRHDVHRRLGALRRADPARAVAVRVGAARSTTTRSPRWRRRSWSTRSAGSTAMTFPTRLRAVGVPRLVPPAGARRRCPPASRCVAHERAGRRRRATAPDGRQCVVLGRRRRAAASSTSSCSRSATSTPSPDADGSALAPFAAEHGLVVPARRATPPSRTSRCSQPGADVLALGFGQAFTDLLILVTEGRGGRFVERRATARCATSRAGASRSSTSARGAACRTGRSSTTGCRRRRPRCPASSTTSTIERLLARDGPLDFRRDVLPLVAQGDRLGLLPRAVPRPSRAHDRCRGTSSPTRYAAADGPGRARSPSSPSACPTRPTASTSTRSTGRSPALRFESADDLHAHVARHVAADVARRTDPTYSADLGAFMAMLLDASAPLGRIGASGALTARSRVEDLGRWWFSFFMYYASGPPPDRLRQLLALADAGLLRFIGAEHDGDRRRPSGTLRRPQHEPSRRHRRHGARRRPHRGAVGQPDDRRAAAAAARARRGRRGGRRADERPAGRPTPARSSSPAPTCASSGATAPATPDATPSACSRTARPPARSPGRARTRRRSARTTPSPGRSCDAGRRSASCRLTPWRRDRRRRAHAHAPTTCSTTRRGTPSSVRTRRSPRATGAARRYRPDVSVFHAAGRRRASSRGPISRALASPDGVVRPVPGAADDAARRAGTTVFGGDGHQMVQRRSARLPPELPTIDAGTGRRVDAAAARRRRRRRHGRARRAHRAGAVPAAHDRARRLRRHLPRRRAGGDGRPADCDPPGYCEVSAVCTHPDARRRGYALDRHRPRRRRDRRRGETPFLHVASTNTSAGRCTSSSASPVAASCRSVRTASRTDRRRHGDTAAPTAACQCDREAATAALMRASRRT